MERRPEVTVTDGTAGAEERYVVVGKFSGVFGVHGWLRVYAYTRPMDNILKFTPWYVQRGNEWQALEPGEGKHHGNGLIARLEGIADRDAARPLLGASIAVKRSQLPCAAAGEHYHVDLIGMRVVNREGTELGTVHRIFETGANDVMVVRGIREHLIPLVSDVHLIAIDEGAGRIDVDWGEDY